MCVDSSNKNLIDLLEKEPFFDDKISGLNSPLFN